MSKNSSNGEDVFPCHGSLLANTMMRNLTVLKHPPNNSPISKMLNQAKETNEAMNLDDSWMHSYKKRSKKMIQREKDFVWPRALGLQTPVTLKSTSC